jgi:hypothetical protein
MMRPGSQGPDDMEVLVDRYAAVRLAADPDQLARGRAAVMRSFIQTAATPPAPRRHPLLRGWSLVAAFGMLLIAASSLVAAESGPGQPFYGLRLAIGSATLPLEEPAHERGLAGQLDDRLTEVGAAARSGDSQGAGAAISEYLRTLTELSRDGVTDPAILALIQRHRETLQQLLSVAPAQATSGVRQALDATNKVNGVDAPAGSVVPHPTPAQGAGQSPPSAGKP